MDAFYEIIGYVASALVAISLMMSSILRLRIINLMGAILFTAYGLLIQAYPVAIVNFIIVLINLYFLYDLFTNKEYFRLLSVSPTSDYLEAFLNLHADDIRQIWPAFRFEPQPNTLIYFVLRDLVPAGLIIAEETADSLLTVQLDYVIPGYRDFKIGRFVYAPDSELMQQRPFRAVITQATNPTHIRYLRRMGFRPDAKKSNQYRLTHS